MIPQAFGAVARGRKSVPLEEEHSGAACTGPSNFRGTVAEKLVLDDYAIARLECLVGLELATVARDVGEKDRKAPAIGPTRDRVEVHVAPELSGDVL